MPRKTAPLPPTLEDILKTLGENIKLARSAPQDHDRDAGRDGQA
jgi:hypothetical protein